MKFRLRIIFVNLMSIVAISTMLYSFGSNESTPALATDNSHLVQLSRKFLTEIKEGNPTDQIVSELAKISETELKENLKTDDQKLAFWINIYNAFIQVALKENPEAYEKRTKFFDKKRIEIGGRILSFSNIEHGIIRGSQWAYGLGRIKNPFAPKYHRSWGPSYREPRIHFALNCGAKSCPPVAIYSATNLSQELDFMTKRFLRNNTSILSENQVETTVLFSWFRGDFKGKKGIKRMLKQYEVIADEEISLKFSKYDWSLLLDNFVELPEFKE